MAEGKPDLRTLYKQGEREAVFRELMPKATEFDVDDFRKGLRLDDAQMELIEQMVTIAFEKSELSDYDNQWDPVALTVLYKVIREPVEWLSEYLPEVPKWFTTRWCEHIIKLLWERKIAEHDSQNDNALDGGNTQGVVSAGLLLNEDISPRSSSPRPQIPLKDMICRIELVNQKDGKPQQVADLPLKQCLHPGFPAEELSSYSYFIFVVKFERVLSRDSRDPSNPPVRLHRGTLGYSIEDDRFRSIARQQGFERALEHLYKSCGDKGMRRFTHRKESPSERSARLDTSTPRATSRGRPGMPTQLEVPLQQKDRGRLGASSPRWGSPPPSPVPNLPLPPLPHTPSTRGIKGLKYGEEARENKTGTSSDIAAAERARAAAIETINAGARLTASHTNKPLPPTPGGKARLSDKVMDVLHAPGYATPRTPAAAKKPQNATSSQPHPEATSQEPTTTKPAEPIRKMPFLKRGGGLSTSRPPAPATRISRLPRTHDPPPVSKQAKKAWQIGNQANMTRGGLPAKNPNTLWPKDYTPTSIGIKRGGTSRNQVFSYDGVNGEDERSKGHTRGPFLRPFEAKKRPTVVTPQAGLSRVRSFKVEPEEWDAVTNPEDHTPRSPTKPKRISIVEAAITGAKKRVSQLLIPKLPRPPATCKSTGDVQEIIDEEPKTENRLTPPGPDDPRKSTSSTLTCTASAIKDAKLIVEPPKRKNSGLVRVPKPRAASKIDRFDA
ncbi:hypothetical protein IFR05_002477 [Cadophora sp. M221]|nr:hypothetical protein IFR05_002477 [Cadophora sp. M221]